MLYGEILGGIAPDDTLAESIESYADTLGKGSRSLHGSIGR